MGRTSLSSEATNEPRQDCTIISDAEDISADGKPMAVRDLWEATKNNNFGCLTDGKAALPPSKRLHCALASFKSRSEEIVLKAGFNQGVGSDTMQDAMQMGTQTDTVGVLEGVAGNDGWRRLIHTEGAEEGQLVPESVLKKQERSEEWVLAKKQDGELLRKKNAANRNYSVVAGVVTGLQAL
ncbi:CID domain-containing protein [Artemisia annua]|uniref:CID domain-containing protein n=1 Tax=Artemisia annua TaxID=35608 RepID=A0A2U1MDT6_ARTAN|nr:CID domain-containing protein [Artemisia annua]